MRAATKRPWLCRSGVLAVAGALVVGWVLAGSPPAPAYAAPGEASSRAIATDLVLTPADTGVAQSIATQLGTTSAPADTSVAIPTAAIQADLGPTLGGVSDVVLLETLASESSSNGAGSAASASVGRLEMQTPGGSLVLTDIGAAVSCGRGGGLSASTGGPSLITLDGVPVTADPSGTTVIDLSSGLGTFRITLTAGMTSSGPGSVTATGLVLRIEEDLSGIITAAGTITVADVACESLPVRTTSGTVRSAETGAPLSDVCLVWSPVSAPGYNTVLGTNYDGSFSFDTDEPGPINIGFFVPASPYDCGSATAVSPAATWLDALPLTGPLGADAVAPPAAQQITPGTNGIVACLGVAGPVAAADCAVPDVTLSGRVIGAAGTPEQACIYVLGDPDGAAFGPFVTAADGSWSASGLPRNTPLAVAFIPYFVGLYGPCAADGPPPVSPLGETQPAFFGGVWIDFADTSLFSDPRGWGIARGATLVTNSSSGIDGCLTAAAPSIVPRPGCPPSLASLASSEAGPRLARSGADPIPSFVLALAFLGAGALLCVAASSRRSRPAS